MDEQRSINLLEAYIDNRLTADERRELEALLVGNAAVRRLFWETMQQHAFTQELLGEAQGRSIALTESRAMTLEKLKQEAARMTAAAGASAGGSAAGARSGTAAGRSKTARAGGSNGATGSGSNGGTRRTSRQPAGASGWVFWMAIAAGLLIVGGIGGWTYLHEPAAAPQVAEAQPVATLQAVGSAGGFVIRNNKSEFLTAPMALYAGDLLKTNAGARDASASTVAYADGSRVDLHAGSSLILSVGLSSEEADRQALAAGKPLDREPLGTGKLLELDEGGLTATVAPQPAGRSMVLTTPQGQALVVGTQFSLVISGEKTRLKVTEGHVQFTRTADQQVVQVLAHQYADAGAGIELAAKAIEEPHEVVATEPHHEPAHEPQHETRSDLPREPAPSGDQPGEDELTGRVTKVADRGTEFQVQVNNARNHELIGRVLTFLPGWNGDRKQPKEADVKQIRELRIGDQVRIHYFFEEHYRFRTMVVTEHARHEDVQPHEPALPPHTEPGAGLDGKDAKTKPPESGGVH